MAKESTTFNGGLEIRMMHDKIGRRIQEQCSKFVYFFNLVSEEDKWSWLRLVVVFFLFPSHQGLHYGRPYVLVSTRFYKKLMLRVDDEQKKVRAVEIGAYRRIHMHGDLG
jgi:hypothetical protein